MANYRLQRSDDVQTIDEKKLRKKLRSKDLTGLELVRREDDEAWIPLCETELFREEVPFHGNPLDAARRRDVQGFLGHLTGWVITAGVMAALGNWFPFWLWIWGVFLVVHGLKVAPSALALTGNGALFDAFSRISLPQTPSGVRPALPPNANPSSSLANEAEQVRALLLERGGEDNARLACGVEELAATLAEIARRRIDLENQLSPDKLRKLDDAREEATRHLASASTEQDHRLLRAELEAIDRRSEAIEHAQRTLERLRSRERAAEHQLMQLRLDLSQAEARTVDIPDFADRVETIRIEAAAMEEVDEVLADRKAMRSPSLVQRD